MKKFLILLLLIFSLVLPSTSEKANAYAIIKLQPEKFKSEFDNAVFVGKVELVTLQSKPVLSEEEKKGNTEFILSNVVFATLRPVQSYKAPYSQDIKVWGWGTEGNPRYMKPGYVYEVMIVNYNNYKAHFSGRYQLAWFSIPEEAWIDYRKNAPAGQPLEQMIKECSAKGGAWVSEFSQNDIDYCHFPTSDGGKVCQSSSECERFCFAFPDETERQSLIQYNIHARDTPPALKNPGRCGKWKNEEGCHFFIESGKATTTKCIGYGQYK